MRFGYVLLGLVTLTSVHISSGQQCSNGLAGIQNGDVCCDADCGECGGRGCGRLPGGSMNCCTGTIMDSGVMCSTANAAPCIIDDETLCSNGLPGVERNGICCEVECGTCGGAGCAGRPGGSSACCTSTITDSGDMCSTTMEAPCIIDDAEVCSNGVPGVERDDVCCEAQCGTCGGSGCNSRPGGPSACCTSRIEESEVLCSTTMVAPCIIDDESVCSNGVSGVERGDICCEAQCGTCGGSGCARRPGGSEACCTSMIEESGEFCSMTMEAPCIMGDAPAPTPDPTTPPPTTAPPTTAPPTTAPPTTAPPTTAPPTTAPPTTAPPTTAPPTTAPPATAPPTTAPPTTAPPTTAPPTTAPPTTAPPTTAPPTTAPPTTAPPTTEPPTTEPPTTAPPTTAPPTTAPPTTAPPTTAPPTTAPPATASPTQ